jgi:hypothetical protein
MLSFDQNDELIIQRRRGVRWRARERRLPTMRCPRRIVGPSAGGDSIAYLEP